MVVRLTPLQAVGVTEEMVGPEEVMDRVVAPGAAGGEVGTCHHIREVDKLFPAQLPAVQGGGLEPLRPSTLLRPLLHLHLPADHPDRRLQTVPAPAGGEEVEHHSALQPATLLLLVG